LNSCEGQVHISIMITVDGQGESFWIREADESTRKSVTRQQSKSDRPALTTHARRYSTGSPKSEIKKGR
jgi:hypothetical protein